MHPTNNDAITWLVGAAISGFAALCAVAWIYERTRKKFDHPKLGRLTFEWDSWSGLLPHYRQGEPAVRFAIPGSKKAPDDEAARSLVEFWTDISKRVSEVRPHAIEEFMEIASAYEGEPEEELVEQITENEHEDFEKHWCLVGVVLGGEDSEARWTLEFEVEWDPEHTRSAYLDGDRTLLGYGLSCAGLNEDEDKSEELPTS